MKSTEKKRVDLSTFPKSVDVDGLCIVVNDEARLIGMLADEIEKRDEWKRDFEASLRSFTLKEKEWYDDMRNQPPCLPMPDYDWYHLAMLYHARYWDLRTKIEEILGIE